MEQNKQVEEMKQKIMDKFWDVIASEDIDEAIERQTNAITSLLLEARKDGILEGFKMSGEGWNGEYPYGDRDATDEEILADILPQELQAQLTALTGKEVQND